jgi:hypothetical protein
MLRKSWCIALLVLATLSVALAQTTPPAAVNPATANPGALQDGWEQIDQRMVFLTVQLSSVETSLTAVNNAMHAGSHAQGVKRGEVDTHVKGNELMDRNGGGPVGWQTFYGKTAEHFFYHPKGHHEIYINPGPTAQRPPQLDYIYRANAQAAARADADVAALGNQLQVLTDRRRDLEAQQEVLWAKISFQALASRELEDKPIYRFAPAATSSDALATQQADAIGAISRFVMTADRVAAVATPLIEAKPGDTYSKLSQAIVDARHALNEKLVRSPLLATQLGDANSDLGKVSSISKRLAEFAQNIADAHTAAAAADRAQDETRKNTMRATLQQSLMGYAESVLEIDSATSALGSSWHVTPDVKKEAAPVAFDWAAAETKASPTVAVAVAKPPVLVIKQSEVVVEAKHASMNAVATGIMLSRGQTFELIPNESDKWAKGTGTHRGKHASFSGYASATTQTDIRAGANWMALRWRVGSVSEQVQSGVAITAPETGQLELFCNDDKPEKNTGEIHVVIKVSATTVQ